MNDVVELYAARTNPTLSQKVGRDTHRERERDGVHACGLGPLEWGEVSASVRGRVRVRVFGVRSRSDQPHAQPKGRPYPRPNRGPDLKLILILPSHLPSPYTHPALTQKVGLTLPLTLNLTLTLTLTPNSAKT